MSAKYHCRICPFETDDRHGLAGHVSQHRRRGDNYPSRLAVEQENPLRPEDVAYALLNKAAESITNYNDVVAENSGLKTRNEQLKTALKKSEDEKERILKIHNEQAEGSRNLTSSDNLLKIAGIKK